VGETGLVGTTPDLHNHPAWQLRLPEGTEGEYAVSFRFITDSPAYAESAPFTMMLSNLSTPTPEGPTPTSTPTPTRTPGGPICPGDCNGDDVVTVDEVVGAVGAALGAGDACPAMDFDDDGKVSVTDVVVTVESALHGCRTPTLPATFDYIQDTIFSPRCAVPTCHDSQLHSGDLNLEPDSSYDELVGVAPDIDVARDLGYLRVDPGDPENSFLLVKLGNPPLSFGSPMPLVGDPLSAEEIDVIRRWITAGAPP
jgi:hypothetical protein